MSKREKHVRLERKKTDRARRRACGKWTGAALAAIVAVAVPTQVEASPIRFDNPPHGEPGYYEWPTTMGDETHWLDITQPASAQPAPVGDRISFKQQHAASDSRIVTDGTPLPRDAEVEWGGLWGMFLTDVGEGTLIPSGLSWSGYGYIYYDGDYWELEAGVPAWSGLRFDPGDGWHYGWVEVVRDPDGTDPYALEALAWGYETEPGVPIPAGIPEPGSLALLALAAVAATTRRRQRGN